MKRFIVGALVIGALVLVAVAGAASLIVASPGPSPFTAACGNDDFAIEQQQQGSVLYPGAEIEPRSTRFESTIVGEYQQDRWSDGGARGLVTSVSHDNGASWTGRRAGDNEVLGRELHRASDPWVSFAPNGDLYAISLSFAAIRIPTTTRSSSRSRTGDLG